jgi:hypothetical protein
MFQKFTELKLNEAISTGKPESELFGKLFQSRDTAHLIHLATPSYEAHIALNSYYDDIVDLIDKLVESYQGIYGKIEIIIPESCNTDAVPYFTQLHEFVIINKSLFNQNGNLQNTIDEITDLLASTLYKLKELH